MYNIDNKLDACMLYLQTIKNEERGHTKKEGFAHSKDTKTKV